jgi:hypothetical protein
MRAIVRWLAEAWERYQMLSESQQAQARQLVAALQLAPRSGRFWHADADGAPIWFVSAYDTHVVYRVLFYQRNETIYVLDVLVFPHDAGEAEAGRAAR